LRLSSPYPVFGKRSEIALFASLSPSNCINVAGAFHIPDLAYNENMETNIEQSKIDKKMSEVIAENEGYQEVELSSQEQEAHLSKYSFSALVCSAIYFWYMKDKVFFWVSIVFGVLFFPVLFILPIYARRRAWKLREWRSFSQFKSVQEKWDRASVYGLIIFVILIFGAVYCEVKILSNFMNSSGLNNLNDIKQLQSLI